MKILLGIDDIKSCEKIFIRNYATVETIYRLLLPYLKLVGPIMTSITEIDDKNAIIDQKKGALYVSFHFAGNIEGLIYYLSKKYNECYFVYNEGFVEATARSRLRLKTMEAINNIKYVRYYNDSFRIRFINAGSPAILLRIIHAIDKRIPVVILLMNLDTCLK